MNLDSVLTGLKRRFPLFRAIMTQLVFESDNSVGTAATNGHYVWYSENFMNELTFSQQMFVMAHEISHVALNHIERGKDKNHELWNIATDAVINAFIARDGLAWVPGIIDMPGAENKSADEIYQKLLTNAPKEVLGDQSMTKKSHSYWDKEDKTDNPRGKGPSSKGKSGFSTDYTDEASFFEENKKLREEAIKKMKDAIGKGTKGFAFSDVGNSPVRVAQTVAKKSNLIDWRRLLRESVNIEMDYSMKNATIEDGVVVSRLEEIPTADTEILIDTSGSIDDSLLRGFLMECYSILEHSRVRVACFDEKVYDFVSISNPVMLREMELHGGGGTNFEAAVRGFTNRCDNKIIFTDGEGNLSKVYPDIIWIVFGDPYRLPKGSKIIRVDPYEFIRKYKEIITG